MTKTKVPQSCLSGKVQAQTVSLWLNSCDVKVHVRGDICAEVTVTQTFANHLDEEVHCPHTKHVVNNFDNSLLPC